MGKHDESLAQVDWNLKEKNAYWMLSFSRYHAIIDTSKMSNEKPSFSEKLGFFYATQTGDIYER
ncbi:hypothetical protein HYR99_11330 [Candidatus Poribacteria bacterium]|nr:hypothetical protein [Candidatus Poribacteria bacterium]